MSPPEVEHLGNYCKLRILMNRKIPNLRGIEPKGETLGEANENAKIDPKVFEE